MSLYQHSNCMIEKSVILIGVREVSTSPAWPSGTQNQCLRYSEHVYINVWHWSLLTLYGNVTATTNQDNGIIKLELISAVAVTRKRTIYEVYLLCVHCPLNCCSDVKHNWLHDKQNIKLYDGTCPNLLRGDTAHPRPSICYLGLL